MKKQIALTAAVMVVIIALLGGVKYFQISAAIAQYKNFAPPPESVTSIVVRQEEWPKVHTAVGSLLPSRGVTLPVEEDGRVSKINFVSGQTVKAGDVLVELDTTVEEANYRAAAALAEQAKRTLERNRSMRAGLLSKEEFDKSEAAAREATAAAESLRAAVERHRIKAPFDGRTGIRLVNEGQYMKAGEGVVPLQVLDPLYVNFSMPQQALGYINAGNRLELRVDAFPDQVFAGTLTAINPEVDPKTRQVGLQGTIPNPEGRLLPGMFSDVTVVEPSTEQVIAIPVSSVIYAPYGDSVWVVAAGDAAGARDAKQQIVKLGRKRGNQVAVLSGINPGDEVVTTGGFKIRPGSKVMVNNADAPSNDPAPKVADS